MYPYGVKDMHYVFSVFVLMLGLGCAFISSKTLGPVSGNEKSGLTRAG